MTENTPPVQLPVCLPPIANELLSSWIGRHAAFYAVPPIVMLRYCLPEVRSPRAANLHLSGDQEIRLARIFATEPAAIRRMTFTNVAPSARRMISARPLHCCANCSSGHAGLAPILRSQLPGWRIICPLCGDLFQEVGGVNAPPLSSNIAMRPVEVKSCSTMKHGTTAEDGRRQPKSCGFS